MQLISELKRRKVFRVVAGYVVFSWLLIQVVETIFPAFGFDEASFRLLVIALLIGLIPVVMLAWAYELTSDGIKLDSRDQETETATGKPKREITLMRIMRRPRFSVPIVISIALVAGVIGSLWTTLDEINTVRKELLPEIAQLAEQGNISKAFELAHIAEEAIPDDPVLNELWPAISVEKTITSDPAGAEVYFRDYSATDSDWELLGTTPLDKVRLPRRVIALRFEKEGYETAERQGESFTGGYAVELKAGSLPTSHVRVPTKTIDFLLTGYNPEIVEVAEFVASRFEVTNQDFLEFVTDGGYEDPNYWQDMLFVLDGTELGWEESVSRFRDPTGRPGPSTWDGGTFPSGRGDHPVTGVSWFEAAAYARYRNMQLPTIYEWSAMSLYPAWEELSLHEGEAVGRGLFRTEMMSRSNFSGGGADAVGTNSGAGPFGTYDAAGNVREWCWNATGADSDSERYILGGAWDDPGYLFTYGIAESPWNRSSKNGFRLVNREQLPEQLAYQLEYVDRPQSEELPEISDEVFSVYQDLYDYDPAPLNVVEESTDQASAHWVHETISFDATYDDDRVMAHVFLPKNVDPPFQPVIFFPFSDAIYATSSDALPLVWVDFIVKSGRALVIPVLLGTFERNIGLDTTWPKPTREYSEHVVRWIQDFRRTADYLETRSDIDMSKLGFYGYSWGGWNGPVVMALDDRFKAGVYISGGIPPTLARPEASSASFAARVSAPVLMISGKDDVLRPVATYQAPMFDLIGTSDELKKHLILEGGHNPPHNQVVSETLKWFDEHLGLVQ